MGVEVQQQFLYSIYGDVEVVHGRITVCVHGRSTGQVLFSEDATELCVEDLSLALWVTLLFRIWTPELSHRYHCILI